MKNLLIIIPNLNNAGGTERAAVNLANLLSSNYKVTILSLIEKYNDSFYQISPDVKVLYEQNSEIPISLVKKIKWMLKYTLKIKKLTKESDIDIVIGLTHNINCMISLLKKKDLKVIGCEHITYSSIPKLSRQIIDKLYPRLDALIVLSEEAKKHVKYLNKNIIIIPNSLPFEIDVLSSLTNPRILMVGRLSKEKGYDRIINLSKYLLKNYPEWSIHIFGDGILKETILNEINISNLYNIVLNEPTQNIRDEYLKSSIFLSTSRNEAMPMVFLEAMACGLPIISYRNQGADLLIDHNKDGFIVDNEDELINYMSKMIYSHSLRNNMGIQGRLKTLDYTSEKIINKWNMLLEDLS